MRNQLFHASTPAEAAACSTRSMDHRWGRRQSTQLVVDVVAKSGARGNGRVTNVSLTGAYLETPMTLRVFSLVYLEPANKQRPSGKCTRIAASVVRRDSRGVGLEWCEPRTRAKDVNALLDDLGGEAVHESVGGYDRYYLAQSHAEASASGRSGAAERGAKDD